MLRTVFVNVSAGSGSAARKVARVQAAFASRSFPVEMKEPRSADDFRAQVQAAVSARCETFVAMGGDGTLQLLVNEVIGLDVNVGVIPVGGGNDFAAAIGIGRNLEDAVDAVTKGKTRTVDAVRVKFASGKSAVYLGGGGVGLDVEAVNLASGRFQNWPGRLRYLASALAAWRGFAGVNVRVEFPDSGQPGISRKVLIAAAMNTATFGGGLRLSPAAQLDDGLLEVVLLEMLSAREVTALLPRLLVTGELKTKRITRIRAAKLSLRTDNANWFQGDGELLGQAPVEIEVMAKALRVLVP